MQDHTRVREAQERIIDIYRRRPGAAFDTMKASGRIGDGLACRAGANGTEVVMDMSRQLGGTETGPSPGFFIRAGWIGCVAMGVKLTAIREGVPVGAIEVDVEMDFDDGAMFALGTNSAAPLETRLRISVESPAPTEDITAMVDRALAADPYYLALRDTQKVKAEVVTRESPAWT